MSWKVGGNEMVAFNQAKHWKCPFDGYKVKHEGERKNDLTVKLYATNGSIMRDETVFIDSNLLARVQRIQNFLLTKYSLDIASLVPLLVAAN